MTPQPSVIQTLNRFLDTNTPIGRFVRMMMRTIIVLTASGLFVVMIQPIADRITSLLLALACLLLGAFVGFLFGIPRVLQTDNSPAPLAGSVTSPAPGKLGEYKQQVNTNLEQISDWLTKIIVGLGLVNLYKIPDLLRDASDLVAGGIALTKNERVAAIFANALILYFPVLGFLIGYLITRIFLSGVFREADTGRLMVSAQDVGLNTTGEVALTDVVKNLVNVVSTNLATPDPVPPSAVLATPPPTALPKRILWVDDNPSNNALERETLNKEGIYVLESLSTADALSQLAKGSFDLVISDMGRTENGVYNAIAGIDLLKQMHTTAFTGIRTIIYCSKQGAIRYGAQARQAGADDVVYSPRILMKSIGITS